MERDKSTQRNCSNGQEPCLPIGRIFSEAETDAGRNGGIWRPNQPERMLQTDRRLRRRSARSLSPRGIKDPQVFHTLIAVMHHS